MPEAPVHSRADWPHHFAWVRRGDAGHVQAHDLAHSDYSIAYKQGRGHDATKGAHSDYSIAYKQGRGHDATKGAHSHYTSPLVCRWCGGHAPQEIEQWRSQCCPRCGKLNDWPLDQQPDAQQTDRV